LLNFCVNDLSAFYIDVLKDRLYCERKTSIKRRSAQTAIFTIIKELAITIAPILSFTADEIWEHLQNFTKKEASVFFETFPKIENYKNSTLENKLAFIISLKNEVNKKLEAARANKTIGHPLDAKVIIGIDENEKQFLHIDETLEKIFIVSEVEFKNIADLDEKELVEKHRIIVETSKKPKCERCWNHSDSIGKNTKHPKICERCFKTLDES
jgi:isoleucyl-tRNA synthetase